MASIELVNKNQINKFQFFLGTVGLLIGTLVYLIDRPPNNIFFINAVDNNSSLYCGLPNIFTSLCVILSDFIHILSFILITNGIFIYGIKWCYLITFRRKGWWANYGLDLMQLKF